jgi:hypothetical protein
MHLTLMQISSFECLGVGLVMCSRSMVMVNMWCCAYVNYVKAANK